MEVGFRARGVGQFSEVEDVASLSSYFLCHACAHTSSRHDYICVGFGIAHWWPGVYPVWYGPVWYGLHVQTKGKFVTKYCGWSYTV
jgi:hypothetical protein